MSTSDRIWAPHLTPIKPSLARRRGHARRVHPHGCHEYAMKYLLAQSDGILVQAICGEFGVAEHSWIELPEGLAYCGVDAALYPVDGYREAILIVEGSERRYTAAEAAHETLRIGAFGYFAK